MDCTRKMLSNTNITTIISDNDSNTEYEKCEHKQDPNNFNAKTVSLMAVNDKGNLILKRFP